MITKYRIETRYNRCEIEKRIYSGETAQFYIEESNRVKKTTEHSEHCDTWKEAKARLICLQRMRIKRAKSFLKGEKEMLKKINQLNDATAIKS